MRIVYFLAVLLMFASPSLPTSYAPVPIEKLYAESDVVAFVKVVRATTEDFERALYEGVVVEPIKGAKSGERIFFGPYVGMSLGGEYLLFLEKSGKTIGELRTSTRFLVATSDDDVYYEDAFVGFGTMQVDYTCLVKPCGYAVDVAVRHVPLPAVLKTRPYKDPRSRASDFAWVLKQDLLAFLRAIEAKGMAGRPN